MQVLIDPVGFHQRSLLLKNVCHRVFKTLILLFACFIGSLFIALVEGRIDAENSSKHPPVGHDKKKFEYNRWIPFSKAKVSSVYRNPW